VRDFGLADTPASADYYRVGHHEHEPKMTATQLRSVEKKILSWLKLEAKPVSTTELLQKHASAGISAVDLRRAVWGLVDVGKVRFTTDRRLVASE
jgi:hypothetical protein